MKYLLVYLFFLFGTIISEAQKPKLFAGPVVGSVSKNSAKVWIAYRGKGKNAVILGDTATKRIYYPTNYSYLASNGIVALTFDFTDLLPGHQYNILVSIEGWKTNAKSHFNTLEDTTVKDFSFELGSCALMNTDITRVAFPGFSSDIYPSMRRKPCDFMLWLGDNIYYIKAKEYKDLQSMFLRNLKVRRSFVRYKKFLSSMPQYAIWDDHDYGPNDSDKNWSGKDSALLIFKSFWPNTYPEQAQLNGNFFSFRHYDAEFFMLDDRYFRDSVGDSSAAMLGAIQIAWLRNKLLLSDATFKFIAIGTQVISEKRFGETYSQFPSERAALFDFIATNNITGVIFLTGDKHFSEICKKEHLGHTLIDFTASPITTPPLPRWLLGGYSNPDRIAGTAFGRRNYGRISITGAAGDRICTMAIHNRWGRKKREFAIHQTLLSGSKR